MDQEISTIIERGDRIGDSFRVNTHIFIFKTLDPKPSNRKDQYLFLFLVIATNKYFYLVFICGNYCRIKHF